MMWYKNVRLILDSLKTAKEKGIPFRALMVGDGFDAPDIRKYAEDIGLSEQTVFTGAVCDREQLRAFYSLADIFLFPSTFDTSGIVVKEAAACGCPALLVRDSCAAEGVQHGFSGFLAEENADSCAEVLIHACQSRDRLREVGLNAGKHVYLSWDTAVDRAYSRYLEILNTNAKELIYNSRTQWV